MLLNAIHYKFLDDERKAEKYKAKLRSKTAPPIYNEQRLLEEPIPDISVGRREANVNSQPTEAIETNFDNSDETGAQCNDALVQEAELENSFEMLSCDDSSPPNEVIPLVNASSEALLEKSATNKANISQGEQSTASESNGIFDECSIEMGANVDAAENDPLMVSQSDFDIKNEGLTPPLFEFQPPARRPSVIVVNTVLDPITTNEHSPTNAESSIEMNSNVAGAVIKNETVGEPLILFGDNEVLLNKILDSAEYENCYDGDDDIYVEKVDRSWFNPVMSLYGLKLNDLISANLPFRIAVRPIYNYFQSILFFFHYLLIS